MKNEKIFFRSLNDMSYFIVICKNSGTSRGILGWIQVGKFFFNKF